MPAMGHDAAADDELGRLRQENASLREALNSATDRLENAEATLAAIHSGEVDAIVVERHDDPRVFTLESPEKFYLQLAQQVANVGTWDFEYASNRINLSQGLRQLFGITATGPVPVEEIWPRIVDDDLPRVREIFSSLREPCDQDVETEFRVRRPDGSVGWVASKGTVLCGPAGEKLRMVGVNLDITARKNAEQALLESERNFRELADSMPQIVWTARPDGSVEYFNRRWYEYTGQTGAVQHREQRLEIVHPDDRERAKRVWDEAVRRGDGMQIEYRFRDVRRGDYRWHLGRAVPIRDRNGDIQRWFGTATDIHDQKLLQDSLREADHRKDQFLAMLAHELRNPLSPLMIASDLIAAEPTLSSHIREMAEMMTRQIVQLKRLIDDLLDVSRISTGRLELKRERINLRESIDAALDVSRPLIDSSNHSLDVTIADEPIFVEGDQVRLTQVVGNLLINAAKYTPAEGRIRLTVLREGENAVISVEDNGIGIPPTMLSHVFELFTQVDSSTTRSQSGLGIGLTLVKTLVEMHGGEVAALSDGPGRGSLFQVTLPALETAVVSPGNSVQAEGPPQGKRHRILIIDDNQSASFLLGKLLAKLNQDVHVEHSAAQALRCLQNYRPDIVISDIAMPEISGYQLAQQIRQLPLVTQPTLVALTGYGQEDDRRASHAAGFDVHMTKPIDIVTLKKLLNSMP